MTESLVTIGGKLTIREKIANISVPLVLLLCLIAATGGVMLYSAADGSMDPWASRHMTRFAAGMSVMLLVAIIDIRIWMRLAYPIYFIALVLLVLVDVIGSAGMGAQRWIDLGIFQLQPSEIMKVALILAMARYFHGLSTEEISSWRTLFLPIFLIGAPAALVLRQPDLGTALLMVFAGIGMMFLTGIHRRVFLIGGGLALLAIPFAWQFLEDYQRQRILTFLNPESDPLGAGYHIIQSKIALGSGGMWGKGFMRGTQSHLNFLPEQQTDFIFTMLGEELGMVGGLWILGLFVSVLAYGLAISVKVRHSFGQLTVQGICLIFFFYVFTNIAMVMGLVPVVGVPLPLVSYGGTAMLSLLFGFGLVLSADIHYDADVPKRYSLF